MKQDEAESADPQNLAVAGRGRAEGEEEGMRVLLVQDSRKTLG